MPESVSKGLPWTGERMVPESSPERVFWDHCARYSFALNRVRGKAVLDVACGEGYGLNSLRQSGAHSAVGVDVSEAACRHAQEKYGLEVYCSDACQLPFDDSTFDIVVSFETIEHLKVPESFIRECKRVLKPDGELVISTPDAEVYGESTDNKFHCSEMTFVEFTSLIRKYFLNLETYSQGMRSSSWFLPRSLSRQTSVWRKMPLLWRLHRRLSSVREPTENERAHITETIIEFQKGLANRLHPSKVYKAHPGDFDVKYRVAVCSKPKQ